MASPFAVILGMTQAVYADEPSGGSTSIGAAMVSYLNSQIDRRVGGGEGDHLAAEALRIAKGEFVAADLGADAPNPGDRVWGTFVTEIAAADVWSDSNPSQEVRPGDVIQFSSAVFGTYALPERMTAVVAEVQNSRPSVVFFQNLNNERFVQRVNVNFQNLTAGRLRIYRPKARVDRIDEWKVSIVNNTTSAQTYDVLVGIDIIATVQATASSTADSYRVYRIPTEGTVPNVAGQSGGSYFFETGKAYEFVNTTSGLTIRQLAK